MGSEPQVFRFYESRRPEGWTVQDEDDLERFLTLRSGGIKGLRRSLERRRKAKGAMRRGLYWLRGATTVAFLALPNTPASRANPMMAVIGGLAYWVALLWLIAITDSAAKRWFPKWMAIPPSPEGGHGG